MIKNISKIPILSICPLSYAKVGDAVGHKKDILIVLEHNAGELCDLVYCFSFLHKKCKLLDSECSVSFYDLEITALQKAINL